MRARSALVALLVTSVLAGTSVTARAADGARGASGRATRRPIRTPADEPGWQRRIDALVGDLAMSVTIGDDGAFWYRHLAWVARAPASNEKLLLSMALLAELGPDHVMATRAMASAAPVDGVIDGDLWLVGHGDPELGPDALQALARQIDDAGVTRIAGLGPGRHGAVPTRLVGSGLEGRLPRRSRSRSRPRSRSAGTSAPKAATSTTLSCGLPSSSPRRSATAGSA